MGVTAIEVEEVLASSSHTTVSSEQQGVAVPLMPVTPMEGFSLYFNLIQRILIMKNGLDEMMSIGTMLSAQTSLLFIDPMVPNTMKLLPINRTQGWRSFLQI